MPVQVAIAADSHSSVKGDIAEPALVETAKPLAASATRLWAFPNPFEREFQIGFELPAAMVCTVVVQDLQMRPVRVVLQGGELLAGTRQMAVDLGDLPSGVYFVQLQAGGRSYHARVVKQ